MTDLIKKAMAHKMGGWVTAQGIDGENDAFVLKSPIQPCSNTAVVFLGDISDRRGEISDKYRDLDFPVAIEDIAYLLALRLKIDIVIFRPWNMVNGFAEYDNFIAAHDPSLQLQALIDSLNKQQVLKKEIDELAIIVFSRGSDVLNSLIERFFPLDKMQKFWKNCHSLHWIDAHEFPQVSNSLLKRFAEYVKERQSEKNEEEFRITIQSTPRQLNDPERPMIPKSLKAFISMLKQVGVDYREKVYYEGQERSLKMHFDILHEFMLE